MESALKIVGWLLMSIAFLVLLGAVATAAGAPDRLSYAGFGIALAWSGGLFIGGLLLAGFGKLIALAQEQADLLHELVERDLPVEEDAAQAVEEPAADAPRLRRAARQTVRDEAPQGPPPEPVLPAPPAPARIEPRIDPRIDLGSLN